MFILFFFNDTATTEIYTLSLHDALPISLRNPTSTATPSGRASRSAIRPRNSISIRSTEEPSARLADRRPRSEEHTSELQSRRDLVCRLLLEKKKKKITGESKQTPSLLI